MYKIIFLFNIYFSNILYANEWELPCPRNDCFETNNIEWEYFDLDTGIPYYFQENGGQKNPNCWVKVTYRTRKSDDPPCEQEDCEIEILNILVSGSCFYEYIDNSSQPPRIYPPIMSFNQVNQVWNR